MNDPHGGRLVNRILREDHAERVARKLPNFSEIHLSWDQVQDVINIATGRFSPLEGFMNRNDFLKVANDMTLEDGTIWPLPVVLDVNSQTASELNPDTRAALISPDGDQLGILHVDEIFKYNREEAIEEIFGTIDRNHPGVEKFQSLDDFLVGGKIDLIGHNRYTEFDLLPKESRVLFSHNEWDTIVGFQTRNAPHRAHEYIQKSALEFVDGLLIQPKLGDKKSGDYRDNVIMETYETLVNEYFPAERVALTVFPSRMRYAGPREAVFDALVRKNQGCTHFIIGRDHAGVKDYYNEFDAHSIFHDLGDIGIQPVFFNYAFFCEGCDGMASEKICPHEDEKRVYPSGSRIRKQVRKGNKPSPKIMRPEVANYIIENGQPFVE